eukprot:365776-Chlamydomonas_euryale.AAC.4
MHRPRSAAARLARCNVSPTLHTHADNATCIVGCSFRNRDLYMDPVPLLTSAIVLLWVLGFMANRIFGIDTQAVK